MGMIYADHNAASPLRPEAKAAMLAAFADGAANPSSVHALGRRARATIERARTVLGAALGTRGEDIVFTSGGTEAANLAVHGVTAALGGQVCFLVSAIEHEAIARAAAQSGTPILALGVSPDGCIDLAQLAMMLNGWDTAARGTPVLCLMLANNETGVLQPVAAAAALVRAAGGLTVCDAVQGLGKVGVNVGLLGVDYLFVSAHKIGGPSGAGALWHRPGAPLGAVQHGGGQERGLRSGTENVAAIAGFGAATEAALGDLQNYAALARPRDAMEARLKSEGGITVIGENAPRLAGTSCFARPGFRAETQVMALDMAGVCVSAGSACSSGKVKRSLVLKAMGLDDTLAETAIRASFGWESSISDFDGVAAAWLTAARRTVLKETV
jgi:cysteine desulfurase